MRTPDPARSAALLAWLLAAPAAAAQEPDIQAAYQKSEHRIPMRDGARLFTAVYAPRDTSQTYPILMLRTPYGVSPYGPDQWRPSVGPSALCAAEKFIFVHQDVRGRYMSEGEFVMMTPHKPVKRGPKDVDESSDTFDTIDWLLRHVPGHNGRVGMWGISYPGFYATVGMIDAHPALVAVSPQAPVADMFVGDDFHHHGAFFLAHAFRFLSSFGRPRPGPTTEREPPFDHGTPDGYRFFLEMGPLANADERYFKGGIPIWSDYMAHPDYDAYWQAQSVLPHLRGLRPAVLTVGGWFDSEDLHGPLKIYKTIEKECPGAANSLVMGPWSHGGWSRSDGDRLGHIGFGSKTSLWFREHVELAFFKHHLKGKGEPGLPEALVFETGANAWRSHEAWPPGSARSRNLYLLAGGRLGFTPPSAGGGDAGDPFDEYLSDPARPVPFTAEIRTTMGHEFMIEDQRFAWTRPDVLSYESEPLAEDLTVVGPIMARLFVESTGSDADFVVKLIDVFPDDLPDPEPNPCNVRMGGFQMLVRGEVMRARYRRSYQKPEALAPGEIVEVPFELQDTNHRFLARHRIMVQIQSTWFPLVDRNPQVFVDIRKALAADFRKATHRIHRSGNAISRLELLVLP